MTLNRIEKIKSKLKNSETELAIHYLESLLIEIGNSKLQEELLIITAQFKNNLRDNRLGLINNETYSICTNRVHLSISQILTQLEILKPEEYTSEKTSNEINSIDSNFPTNSDVSRFRKFLLEEISILNLELNWNPNSFTPLESKVIVKHQQNFLSEIRNLESVLKGNIKPKATLIIGEPGSGKSVAMRTFYYKLLTKSNFDRIPIYINLKDWDYSENNISNNSNKLYHFVYQYLERSKNLFAKKFIKEYFNSLYNQGRFIFLLDSFDEIKQVIDNHEKSELIDEISSDIFHFIGNCSCILTSREFKKPTLKFLANLTLYIQPYSEDKAINYYNDHLDKNHVKEIFKTPLLRSLSQNPLLASLVVEYIKRNNTIPPNQLSLYDSFIRSRLDKIEILKGDLSNDHIILRAMSLSLLVQERKGFDIGIENDNLPDQFKNEEYKLVLKILKKAKLIRAGNGRISFLHRRFHEYFIVLNYIHKRKHILLDDIADNNSNRDALILYSETANDDEAIKIIEFCLSYILNIKRANLEWGDKRYNKAVHCLRFIVEAFRNRKSIIGKYYTELLDFIYSQTENGKNLVVRKHAIEATVLLNQNDAETIIDKNFMISKDGSYYNLYLLQSILESSKYLRTFNSSLSKKFITYYGNTIHQGIINTPLSVRKNIRILSISGAFYPVKKYLQSYLYELIFSIFAFPLLSVFIAYSIYIQKGSFLIAEMMVPIIFLMAPLMQMVMPSMTISYNYHKNKNLFIGTIFLFISAIIVLTMIIGSINFSSFDPEFRLALLEGFLLIVFVIFGLAALFIIPIFFTVIRGYRKISRYNKNLLAEAKLEVKNGMKKELIEYYFFEIQHSNLRKEFIQHIKEKQIVPVGKWTSGKIPNYNDDTASGLLAELEENWLSLNK